MAGKPKGLPKTGGRTKGTPNRATADIKALAQVHAVDAVATLAEIMKGDDYPPAARVAAARELMDRGFGKATQPIAGDPDLPPVALMPTTIQLVAPGDDG
ncbi:hypothetical protein E2544_20140 [Achromobacter insolitus]|uniref:hypothetical protein n=1 Tax=Achromobacter insolitus TaxID=217204 RepID=UPI0011EB2468|nr:hypothetical protein [Achromobacter insolitus]QEK93993.1 hypothetical protein E2544_20140 [Achromobacter insolitus]